MPVRPVFGAPYACLAVASEYSTPVLGLIFRKFADINYRRHEPEILAEFEKLKGGRREMPLHEIAIAKCGFYLPENARYSYLLNLPEDQDIAKAIETAMESIEEYKPESPRIPRPPCLENGKRGFVSCLEEKQVGIGSTKFIVFRERVLPAEYICLLSCHAFFRQHAELSMTVALGIQRVQHDCFGYFFIPKPPEKLTTT
ncbi:MAG: type I restriction-modification system subunit M N-terminal domain-containing protein, partial [Kiritimatiellia bacterium]